MTELGALTKFMQTLDDPVFKKLNLIAEKRGVGIQELIRAVIVPEWLQVQEAKK